MTNVKIGAGAVTPSKMTSVFYQGSMTAGAIGTSFGNVASQVLPAGTMNYLILGVFEFNNNAGVAGDLTGAIRNGTTTLAQDYWFAPASTYFNTISLSYVFAASGGETINFSVLRSAAGSAVLNARSSWRIIALGA